MLSDMATFCNPTIFHSMEKFCGDFPCDGKVGLGRCFTTKSTKDTKKGKAYNVSVNQVMNSTGKSVAASEN